MSNVLYQWQGSADTHAQIFAQIFAQETSEISTDRDTIASGLEPCVAKPALFLFLPPLTSVDKVLY